VFAQSLTEYGVLHAIVSGFQAVRIAAQNWFDRMDPLTIFFIGGFLMLWIIARSFRGRRL
jgi:hypothetical protein